MSIRIIIADDHPLVRSGIRMELTQHDEFEIIGESINGDEALNMVLQFMPDILLLDVNMPGIKAVKVLATIKQELPCCQVIVLTAFKDLGTILGMLKAGASGFLIKDEEPEIISKAIHAVFRGKLWLSDEVKSKISTAPDLASTIQVGDGLTSREMDVLNLIGEGLANKQIADKLSITERTVEFHVCNILRKTNLNSRVELILWIKGHGVQ